MVWLREHKTRRATNSPGFALIWLFIVSLLSNVAKSLAGFLMIAMVNMQPVEARRNDRTVGTNKRGVPGWIVHGYSLVI